MALGGAKGQVKRPMRAFGYFPPVVFIPVDLNFEITLRINMIG